MSAAGSAVKKLLDRPGLRGLLAVLLTHSAAARATGAERVFYREGGWVSSYPDGFVVASHVDLASTPAVLDAQTRENWEYAYTPAEGDVVVDVGAGTGTEILRWSRAVGPTGRVVAIEAHPVTFGHLRLACDLNGLKNVELVNRAVSDKQGTVRVSEWTDYWSASIAEEGGALEVEAETLDDLLARLGVDSVDYLKMNIEGAETAALAGMPVTLSRLRYVCISCHDFRAEIGHGECYRTREQVARLLGERGFTLIPRPDDRAWISDQVNARSAAALP